MTDEQIFMTFNHAQTIYESLCTFIYSSQIPTVCDEDNNPVKEKTLLVCYEEIGDLMYVNLKHLYTEDGETLKVTTFKIRRHTQKVEEFLNTRYDMDKINLNEFLVNSKLSLINSSKGLIHYIKNMTNVLSSDKIVHPAEDVPLKKKGKNKTLSFYTDTMYHSSLSNNTDFR